MLKKVKVLLLLISLSVSVCLMSNTYSRYVAQSTGNVDISVANWQILVSNTDVTSRTSSSLTFQPVMIPNENVASDSIAPSSTGYFDIDINPTNVDVSFKYDISLNFDNTNMPDIMITKYSIVPYDYIEDSSTPLEEINIVSNTISNTLTYDNEIPNFSFSPFKVRVYFEWLEGAEQSMDDTSDTALGNEAATNNTSFNISANIEFEQVL